MELVSKRCWSKASCEPPAWSAFFLMGRVCCAQLWDLLTLGARPAWWAGSFLHSARGRHETYCLRVLLTGMQMLWYHGMATKKRLLWEILPREAWCRWTELWNTWPSAGSSLASSGMLGMVSAGIPFQPALLCPAPCTCGIGWRGSLCPQEPLPIKVLDPCTNLCMQQFGGFFWPALLREE